ncbi:roadblock/LC7 domain-containing protein [Methanopyrus kandleri]|uniref:Predicted regulator of Ras-like GTPase activity, member of the Roadblock/LC7/MglB family n=1 Tax=Methanopyrus kandleri (strain AV19 / DSM 6324 / JCM 9639 / NBRC 100938) TaxID=190192 RepID=Q8TVR3_METKA|nr:roadblock/LC7 domain-containing protein [Methanopyrus kandleri]AAM02538.1 Predicted regulator of Ras-like GTPase activity, member of the Roadblock/LC7/MglB family [Methanopyrus kandleri AV19]
MIEKVLADLNRVAGVNGSMVASSDGLVVAEAVPPEVDPEIVGAIATTVYGSGERVIEEMELGELKQMLVESTDGKVVIIRVDDDALLVLIADPDANLGLIRLKAREAAEEISKQL